MVANQVLYINYKSRHWHTSYGQNSKSVTINDIGHSDFFEEINKYKD